MDEVGATLASCAVSGGAAVGKNIDTTTDTVGAGDATVSTPPPVANGAAS